MYVSRKAKYATAKAGDWSQRWGRLRLTRSKICNYPVVSRNPFRAHTGNTCILYPPGLSCLRNPSRRAAVKGVYIQLCTPAKSKIFKYLLKKFPEELARRLAGCSSCQPFSDRTFFNRVHIAKKLSQTVHNASGLTDGIFFPGQYFSPLTLHSNDKLSGMTTVCPGDKIFYIYGNEKIRIG